MPLAAGSDPLRIRRCALISHFVALCGTHFTLYSAVWDVACSNSSHTATSRQCNWGGVDDCVGDAKDDLPIVSVGAWRCSFAAPRENELGTRHNDHPCALPSTRSPFIHPRRAVLALGFNRLQVLRSSQSSATTGCTEPADPLPCLIGHHASLSRTRPGKSFGPLFVMP